MGRIKSLEGGRGLGAIIVMMTHFFAIFYPAVIWGKEHSHLRQGLDYLIGQMVPIPSAYSGVAFFFIMTGLGTYMAITSGKLDIRKYLLLRYFKLLVLVLLGAVPVAILLRANLVFVFDIMDSVNSPWLDNWPAEGLSLQESLFHNPLEAFMAYNGVLWTMKYFFWGTLLSFVLTRLFNESLRDNFCITVIASLIFWNIVEYNYIPFVVGVFLGYCCKYQRDRFCLSLPARIAMALAAIYLCSYPDGMVGTEGIYLQHGFTMPYIPYNTLGDVLFIMLLFQPESLLERAMESRPMQWLGRCSMGIYIIHYSLVVSLASWIFSQMPESMGYSTRILLVLIAYTVCCLAAGRLVQSLGDWLCRLLDKAYKYIFRI